MNTYTDDPNHWTNRFPWQRRGTKIRDALEQFLRVAEDQAPMLPQDPRTTIAWLRTLLDRTPQDLFGKKPKP